MSAKSVGAASTAQTAEYIVFVKAAQARRWQHQGSTSPAVEFERSVVFGQGGLEAGQSKHTRTPPLAAEQFIAAAALRHQVRKPVSVQGGLPQVTASAVQAPRRMPCATSAAQPQHLSSRSGDARIQTMKCKDCCGTSPVRPNPSLKRSANGRPPGPGRRYGVHFRQPGPGVLPLSPA